MAAGIRELDDDAAARRRSVFFGKPDIYHALQACLIPLLPATGSITRGLSQGVLSLESETLRQQA